MRITKDTQLTNDMILDKILSMQSNRHARLKKYRLYYDFFEKPLQVTFDYIQASVENTESDSDVFNKYYRKEGI